MGLPWLVRLGWVAITGQVSTIALVHFGLGIELPLAPLGAVIAIAVAIHVGLEWTADRPIADVERACFRLLLADTAILSVLLGLTGGAKNPFAILYLVHVTLAAVTLRALQTWVITAVSIFAYGALSFIYRPFHPGPSRGIALGAGLFTQVPPHLDGMFVAFALTAVLVAWFVTGVNEALLAERERTARVQRLVSLTTLAAGAAHELATPLGTIKVAARELERALEAHPSLGESLDDAKLVRREVERAREVLDRLAAGSGASSGEAPVRCRAGDLVTVMLDRIGERRARVSVLGDVGLELHVPRESMVRALLNLVENALDASELSASDPDLARTSDAPGEHVEITVGVEGTTVVFTVADRGPGIPKPVLDRLGEPFFTTKPVGRGMGLGVYLVRTLAESLGGALEHEPRSGGGTTARLRLGPRVRVRGAVTAPSAKERAT